MKFTIRDFLAIEFGEIEVSKITIVGGLNARGKSSICEAARAILTSTPLARGMTKKNEGAKLLRAGTEKGYLLLEGENGSTRITYPKCEVSTTGEMPPKSSRVGSGAIFLSELTGKERSTYILELLKSAPSEEMWMTHMLAEKVPEASAKTAWARIQEFGWDGFHVKRKDAGAKLKGQWEETTVDSYGPTKADNWEPGGYDTKRSEWTLEQWDAAIAEAKSGLEASVGSVAVESAERQKRVTRAGQALVIKANLEAAILETGRLKTLIEGLRAKKADLGALPGDVASCPHCGKAIVPKLKDSLGRWIVDKGTSDLSGVQLTQLRAEHTTFDQEIAQAQTDLQASLIKENGLRSDAAAADEASAWLDANPETEAGDETAITKARNDLMYLQVGRDAAHRYLRAHELNRTIKMNKILIDALAPDGLRQRRAEETVGGWLKQYVDPIAEAFMLAPISFDMDFNIRVGDRPMQLLAESEQYRVDIALQLSVALQDGSSAVVIDRADLLLPDLRKILFQMLAKINVPALVAMAARSPEMLPKLKAAGAGNVYWVDSGKVTEIGA